MSYKIAAVTSVDLRISEELYCGISTLMGYLMTNPVYIFLPPRTLELSSSSLYWQHFSLYALRPSSGVFIQLTKDFGMNPLLNTLNLLTMTRYKCLATLSIGSYLICRWDWTWDLQMIPTEAFYPLHHLSCRTIQCEFLELISLMSCGGARGVMVIVVGNGHGEPSSNSGRDWLHFT